MYNKKQGELGATKEFTTTKLTALGPSSVDHSAFVFFHYRDKGLYVFSSLGARGSVVG
jgi:hypothetical protein